MIDKKVDATSIYRKLLEIRAFEESLLDLFSLGKIRGTTHTCIGQEATAVAVMDDFLETDTFISNHRCHGHFIAYSGKKAELLAEILGKNSGLCKGVGGSQHIQFKNFYSNGIQGGIVPLACGFALASKIKADSGIATCFIGDGTMGEGVVYESINMASLWCLPTLFIVENNKIAQSTPQEKNLAGNLAARFRAFDIETIQIEAYDVFGLIETLNDVKRRIRQDSKPRAVVIDCVRIGPHSKGDDTRSANEINEIKIFDPIGFVAKQLDEKTVESIKKEVYSETNKLIQLVLNEVDGQYEHLDQTVNLQGLSEYKEVKLFDESNTEILFIENIRNSLASAVVERNVVVLGEDIHDPYGGAFKATKGISSYANNIYTTPISEGAIVGIGNGLALRGVDSIVEIMFGDFATLAVDQLINHSSKFYGMYAGKTKCPLIVRMPMGGYRGYGPTHSQSLERLFLGFPNLLVIAANNLVDQKNVFSIAFETGSPTVYLENKMLYSKRPYYSNRKIAGAFTIIKGIGVLPAVSLRIDELPIKGYIIAYGGMTELAIEAAMQAFRQHEIGIEVKIITVVSPIQHIDYSDILEVNSTIFLLEEACTENGWTAEVACYLRENSKNDNKIVRIGAVKSVIPSRYDGEEFVLPNVERIVRKIHEYCDE